MREGTRVKGVFQRRHESLVLGSVSCRYVKIQFKGKKNPEILSIMNKREQGSLSLGCKQINEKLFANVLQERKALQKGDQSSITQLYFGNKADESAAYVTA